MILPSKHLPQERALLTVGAELLTCLHQPMTVSALWQKVAQPHKGDEPSVNGWPISFDWFVLALDLLYTLGAVHLREGILVRSVGLTDQAA